MSNIGSKITPKDSGQLIERLGRAGVTEREALTLLRDNDLVKSVAGFILHEAVVPSRGQPGGVLNGQLPHQDVLTTTITHNQSGQLIERLGGAGVTGREVRALLHDDQLVKKTARFILEHTQKPFKEFMVHVEYEEISNQDQLHHLFDHVDLSDLEWPWEDRSPGRTPLTPRRQTFVLRPFLDPLLSTEIIQIAKSEQCRPATLQEAIAFATAHPSLQRECPIVILGSWSRRRSFEPGSFTALHYPPYSAHIVFAAHGYCVSVLFGNEKMRGIRSCLDSFYRWEVKYQFLLVRS